MKRKDKVITDRLIINEVMRKGEVCRLAINDESSGYPYIVPMSYGLSTDNDYIYFHSATVGKKLELMKKNDKVSFEISDISTPVADSTNVLFLWAQKYKSIIGYGRISFIEDLDEKQHAVMAVVLKNARGSSSGVAAPPAAALDHMCVFKLKIEHVSGRDCDVSLAHPGGHPGGHPQKHQHPPHEADLVAPGLVGIGTPTPGERQAYTHGAGHEEGSHGGRRGSASEGSHGGRRGSASEGSHGGRRGSASEGSHHHPRKGSTDEHKKLHPHLGGFLP